MSRETEILDTLDTVEDVLLEWALFKQDHDITDATVAEGDRIVAEEKAKKAGN